MKEYVLSLGERETYIRTDGRRTDGRTYGRTDGQTACQAAFHQDYYDFRFHSFTFTHTFVL